MGLSGSISVARLKRNIASRQRSIFAIRTPKRRCVSARERSPPEELQDAASSSVRSTDKDVVNARFMETPFTPQYTVPVPTGRSPRPAASAPSAPIGSMKDDDVRDL